MEVHRVVDWFLLAARRTWVSPPFLGAVCGVIVQKQL